MADSRLLPVAVILAVSAPALVHGAEVRSSQTDRSLLEATPTAETTLSRNETARAQAWGLSEIEWRRYQSLMQGIRGSVSPNTISPIEVLGIHARDEAERRRYAERWAQAMWEDAERILAFQRAYVEAGRRLYPNVPLIDPSRLPGKGKQTTELQTKDRVLLFTRPDCPPCDALLARVLERIEQVAGIDIYLAGIEPGQKKSAIEDNERGREGTLENTVRAC